MLYKNGIGYFEHTARVRGNQDLAIDFTTAQLNDVLKSLTVVDLGEGRISGVRYNSTAPLDERLKALRLPFGEQVTRADFLTALRGARVEVRSGAATATGRLLSVEKERKANGKGDFYDVTEFSIVSDAGEMKNFDLGPGTSVRLAERDLGDEIGRYLNLVGSSRARDLRRMTISARARATATFLSATSARCLSGRARTASFCRTSPTKSRCCKAGPSWTTRLAKTGKMFSFRWSPPRRNRSSRTSRSLIMPAAPWWLCPSP